MGKYQVLQILTSVDYGGVEKYVQLLSRNLDPELFEVTVAASPRGARTEAVRAWPVRFYPIPHFRKAIQPWNDWTAFRELHRLMRTRHFDLVHTHMFKAGALGRLAARANGVPAVLFTAHGFHYNTFSHPVLKGLARLIETALARHCSHAVLTVSRTEADQALALGLIPPAKLRTVYPGIEIVAPDVKPEAAADIRRRFGLSPADALIGTVGRLARQKAPLDLVRTAEILRRSRGDIHVLFAGDGPLRRRVEREIRRRGLERRVHILGYTREVDTVLGLLDVFVLPSLYEGQPISIMEAMLNRVPVVATGVNGVGEIVRDGVTGSLVPPSQPERIAAAVLDLLSDSGRRERYAAQALEHLQTHYSVGRMTERIQEIYLELLAPEPRLCGAPSGRESKVENG